MKSWAYIAGVIVAAACGAALAADAPAVAVVPPSTANDAALAPLQQLSQATQALYGKVSGGLVRIRVEQNPESLLRAELKPEWDQYREQFSRARSMWGMTGPGIGGRGGPALGGRGSRSGDREEKRDEKRDEKTDPRKTPGRGGAGGPGAGIGGTPPALGAPGGAAGEGPRRMGPGTQYGRGPAATAALLERFLDSRTSDPDAAKAAEAHTLLARVRSIRQTSSGDLLAIVYDTQGHALLLTAVALPADRNSFSATTSDGTEVTARVLATNFLRGITVLRIEPKVAEAKGDTPPAAAPTPAAVPPITMVARAEGRPSPGELLMHISAHTSAVTWISAPSQTLGSRKEERFATAAGDDRAGGFVFNSSGQLAAVAVDRSAVPISALAAEIKAMEEGKSINPRPLGVAYDPVLPGSEDHQSHKLLGNRAALRVKSVLPGSAAEKAGIKPGDYIVTIDKRPVSQIQRVVEEWATRTAPVRVGIVRGDETLERELPIERTKE